MKSTYKYEIPDQDGIGITALSIVNNGNIVTINVRRKVETISCTEITIKDPNVIGIIRSVLK